ncbi:hypothetical protein J2S74_000714 [Evansella vedderi]|uniref:Phage conserved hypothetical protein C-terminal domain-containing protein n=1 Tax=Evansella vedderi TaxID=38282 RepID=A0ABT9ZQ24_9BACI|nr:conserved phage C-terminal domain-containing protein [Evansella vedderi]MDQ0253342.1 hypothetical protein [Evansella vedderi]
MNEEGYLKVIDNKTADELYNPKMNKFLRPSTLFGPKFASYLNEEPVEVKKTETETDFDLYLKGL